MISLALSLMFAIAGGLAMTVLAVSFQGIRPLAVQLRNALARPPLMRDVVLRVTEIRVVAADDGIEGRPARELRRPRARPASLVRRSAPALRAAA